MSSERLNERQISSRACISLKVQSLNHWMNSCVMRRSSALSDDEALADAVYRFIVDVALSRFQALAREAESWLIR
ncbi:hypothetical protein [Halochromatium roseum]|uniref:hypothetical protein n=1 Tax=Halochromatium roseum TaxID=391920 RepID=UPI001914162C|nr:hypothetical protein [Halochromatium roseum]